MKLSKFKTICHSDTEAFDNELSSHINSKWSLQGAPRTVLSQDGTIQHFQTIVKEFELGSDEGKLLFNQATELLKNS